MWNILAGWRLERGEGPPSKGPFQGSGFMKVDFGGPRNLFRIHFRSPEGFRVYKGLGFRV